MDMGACGGAGNCTPKSNERNTGFSQLVDERLAFGAIGMERYIYRIAMIEAKAIMGVRLPFGSNR